MFDFSGDKKKNKNNKKRNDKLATKKYQPKGEVSEDTLELNYEVDEASSLYFDNGPSSARVLAPGFLSIISGKRGSGKAQPLDSKILTEDGFVLMKDISIGDKIFGEDGELHCVIDIIPQDNLDLYEVEFRDGSIVQCNDEHLWTVLSPKNKLLTKNVKELISLNYNNYACHPLKPIKFKEQKLEIDPYLVGALIADGALTRAGVTFCSNESDIVDKVAEIVGENFIVNRGHSTNFNYLIRPKEKYQRNSLDVKLKKLGLKDYSHKKFIPRQYLFNSIGNRIKLIRGLFDCDGNISGGVKARMTYSTTSTELKNDILFLLKSLGYIASVSIDNRVEKYKSGVCYTIMIKKNKNLPVIFSSKKHKDKYNIWLKGTRLKFLGNNKIKDIRKMGVKLEMQCITTSNPKGLYITDNFTVTHNSQLLQPIIASCISGNKISKWIFESKLKTVCHIDTELPEILSDAQEETIFKISGLEDGDFLDRYNYYNLVEKTSFRAKKEAVKEIMMNQPASLYVIDNITGLSDPNNKDTAYELAYFYNAVARKTKSVVIVAGHNNKEGEARGWLGKIFEEISSTALNLFLHESIGTTVINPVKDRLQEFDKTSFTVNQKTKEVVFGRYLPFPTQ